VIDGGVRAGVARSEHRCEGFAGACSSVVDERQQWVKSEAALVRWSSELLVRVGGDQCRIEVEDEWILGGDVVIGGVLTGMCPRCGASGRPRGVDRGQHAGCISGQRGDQA